MGKGGQNYGKRETTGSNTQSNRVVFAAWAKDVGECEEELQVNRDFGLSPDEVEKRRQIYGWNELEKHEGQSIFSLILEQFNDTLVRILLVAAVISFVLALYDGDEGGEMAITAFVEPLVIFLILIVNAIVGVWQESNAEKALEALKEIQSQQATVFRNGKKYSSLPAKELVPGDIVELRVGDKVPADMRVLNLISSTLRVEQGSLTGESEAVSKTVKPVAEDSEIQGKKCMVFAGTTVVNGNCISVVTQTGMNTEIGKVHSQIHEASQSEEDTPLKKKLNEFGEVLTLLIGLICALVWLINVKYFLSWEYVDGWPTNFKFSFEKCTYYFEIAVALAVAAIPEGLPAVITTCLALGTRKMAQKNALVRKLPSVETLGCTTVICSDKTGTLTTNQMAVAKIVAMGPRVNAVRLFNVEGTTYNPCDGKIQDWPQGRMDTNLQTIAKIAAICNDASIEQAGNHYVASGMPTEAALKVLVEKMGLPDVLDSGSSSSSGDAQRCCKTWSRSACRIATLEFDRDRKSMGVIVRSNSGSTSLLVKGAVENLLERSSFIQLLDGSVVERDQNARDVILQSLHEMSSTALRVLGFAYKEDPSEFATYTGDGDHPAHDLLLDPAKYSSIESKLVFAGLAGLRDPPRKEVRQFIEDCRAAGIQVMVITGDNKNTAEAICREIGVFGPNEDISSKSLTGREFMDPQDQKSHLRQSGGLLFSRAEPRHKQEIVRLLKEDGEVVAMTGDGLNDAPALKLTGIGIAMGITGTKVAKEASDMVLADDNFSTIVAAVGEGRSIYNNMKAFIRRRLLPSSSSWSEIPEELLRLIFERISDWSDLHPCLGVCPLWRSTAQPVLSRIIASAFLLLINPEQKQQPCKFLDSSATTFCIKARMELANYTIHNSNRGWLLMHSPSQEYSLYNPITREIVQLPSPPNGPFSNLVYINPPPAEAESKVFRIHKFVMSTSPRDPDCVVCILSQHRNNLAFCKPASSDKSFKLITSARAGIYSDMIFYKGEFYAVNGFNELYVMKILERDNQIVAVQEHAVVLTWIRSSGKARQFYLAEEPVSKELLLVEKVQLLYWDSAQRKDTKMISKTVSFRFFKLKYKYYYNSAAATAVWEEVVRRVVQWDHHALLLVSGGSMFVSTDDDQTCSYKPNCIYFVDEFYNSDPLNYLKVYDLKSNTVEPFNFNPSCYNSQRLASDGLCTWFRASAV